MKCQINRLVVLHFFDKIDPARGNCRKSLQNPRSIRYDVKRVQKQHHTKTNELWWSQQRNSCECHQQQFNELNYVTYRNKIHKYLLNCEKHLQQTAVLSTEDSSVFLENVTGNEIGIFFLLWVCCAGKPNFVLIVQKISFS